MFLTSEILLLAADHPFNHSYQKLSRIDERKWVAQKSSLFYTHLVLGLVSVYGVDKAPKPAEIFSIEIDDKSW